MQDHPVPLRLAMRIVYLYSELGPYNIPVLRELVREYGAEILVVHWDKALLKPFAPPPMEGVRFVPRSRLDSAGITMLCLEFKPDVLYVSGWMDRGYLPAAAQFVRRGVPVVAGFDDRWTGSARQIVASNIVAPMFREKFFSHAWVAGPEQYSYARRLGFDENRIIFDLLTADVPLFTDSDVSSEPGSPFFFYAGNYRAVKGTDVLLRAYSRYREERCGGWRLVCAGGGDLERDVSTAQGVEHLGYLDQVSLRLAAIDAGAFVLPSRHDQWGVVVHEFAALGLPMLLSTGVGAASSLLIDGWNGFRFEAGSVDALLAALVRMSACGKDVRNQMRIKSRELALRITPKTSAANLASLVVGRS